MSKAYILKCQAKQCEPGNARALLVNLVLVVCCWLWSLSLSDVYTPVRLHWRKQDLSLKALNNWRYLLGLECELMSCLHPQCWDSWLEPLQTLYMMPQSLCIYMCINPDIYARHCFFALLIFLCPLLYSSLTMREGI